MVECIECGGCFRAANDLKRHLVAAHRYDDEQAYDAADAALTERADQLEYLRASGAEEAFVRVYEE